MGTKYRKTKTGIIEITRIETDKELIEDLKKRIKIIGNMKELVNEKFGKVSVSYDTDLCVMGDYCDYLVEELEKRIREIKKGGLK